MPECNCTGGDFFSKFAFAGVLIDEAAQATELAAIVPLILRGGMGWGTALAQPARRRDDAVGSQRLVLVGDQCQLPPTVQSSEAPAGACRDLADQADLTSLEDPFPGNAETGGQLSRSSTEYPTRCQRFRL